MVNFFHSANLLVDSYCFFVESLLYKQLNFIKEGMRQFDETNLRASQFVGEPIRWEKIRFAFSSVEATTKSYVVKAIKKAIAIIQLIRVKVRI